MPWVSLLIVIPLVTALVLTVLPRRDPLRRRARAVALTGSVLALAATVVVVALFERSEAALQQVDHVDWIASVGVAWDVGVDGISIWIVLLTTVVFSLATLAICQRMPERGTVFLALIMLAEGGLLGLFTAGDMILFYVFWEVMLIPFALLIWNWGGNDRTGAGLTFVVYTMVGSLIMLVAIIATALIARDHTGTLSFLIRDVQGVPFGETTSTVLLAGFLVAFAIKLPLFPFHGWLPRAYSQAPLVVTILLAAVMSKAGVYGLLRIGLPVFPEGIGNLFVPLVVLALIGIIYGSLLAWRAPTMRMLVGYSSFAHLGFVVLGIVVLDSMAAQGAVLQIINHGVVVAAAFVIVMILTRGTGTDEVDRLGGLGKGAPRLAVAFLFVTMAALAVPGSNAFVGEFFILGGVFAQYAWIAAIAVVGVIYAAVYMLRMYQTAMNGPVRGVQDEGRSVELRARDAVVLVPLVLIMLWIALWPASLVNATIASTNLAIAPAQLFENRPPAQIAPDAAAFVAARERAQVDQTQPITSVTP
ncbi:MAG: NADH-quinone oxidoreductase subunit M [Thermoleophilia bacterium]|nr:NADH-quinone oxidoreductase subunit M [Thermoleophilia bacterium]